jgi:hypothetical protein
MAGKLDFDPGQAAMGHKLTISEVLLRSPNFGVALL